MRSTQRGITLTGAIVGMLVIAAVVLFAAKLLPSYLDYFSVQKLLRAMETTGDTKGTVKEIRNSFDRRNSIEGVQTVKGDDLEISKEGGETIVAVNWSVKVPIISNFSACLDFSVSTAK